MNPQYKPEPHSSAPEVLEGLVRQAQEAGASDIHLQLADSEAAVGFRLDGVLVPVRKLERETGERVFGRIKFLAGLKTYQDSLPQDGRIDKATIGAQSDIRVATYPTVTGEKIVLRLFSASGVRALAELGLAAQVQREVENFLAQSTGLLLLTGPAGSGKTTTIYACLKHLAALGGRHVITIEDPAEQVVPGIMQTEVNEARGLDFSKAARHLLRQDPQVLVIGEIRDEETAEIAVRAGLTGHLVISTLHAGSCRGVAQRLLALCKDASAVATSIDLILNQRLLRQLCTTCQGQGCPNCVGTGYHGRVPAVEYLRLDEVARAALRQGECQALKPQCRLADAAAALVKMGTTDQRELGRVLGPEYA